jgi:hypothetical protein
VRCENLGFTPQALRFHRFAVGKAGPRSRVKVDFPAQQKEGAQTSQDRQFKINFSPPQTRPIGVLELAGAHFGSRIARQRLGTDSKASR